VSTLISTVVGIFASYGLVRYKFRGKETLNSFFLSPLIVPAVVTGFSLLGLFSLLGVRISLERLLIAHVIITAPYTIRTISATLIGFDRSLEEAAMSLGANRVRTFLDVTIPMIKFGVVAGAVFAFAMSLDDVSVSIFLADAFSSTLSVNLFAYMRSTFEPTVAAASVLLMGFTFGFILLIERAMGLDKFVGIGI
jgi:putative spermidine/putrescine transport system permease protein